MRTQLIHDPYFFEFSIFAISAFAGFFGAILGLGGGVVIVPALTLGLGINIRYAIGASIVSVIATSSGAAATYVRDHITNVRLALLLEVATTLGAITGAILSTSVAPSWLFLSFALILFYSAALMLKKKDSHNLTWEASHPWAKKLKINSAYPDFVLSGEVHPPFEIQMKRYGVAHIPLGLCLMAGAGVISGLLGIGSGALKVPAMDTAMRLPIKVSSATSNFMIGVTAAASAGAYYMKGDILPIVAAPVALGVLLGAFLGARTMMKLRSQIIRKLFVVILLVIATQMAIKALGMGHS